MWDIATRFLKSPWHWARIWKINQAIKNPHLIYPGDVIVLRHVDGQPELGLLRAEKLSPDDTAATTTTVTTRAARSWSGDVLRLQPRIHSEALEGAIPTIPPGVIMPFLTQPLAVGERELNEAGYVTIGLDNRIALGDHSEFYARGVTDQDAEFFQIFRPGKRLEHPDTGELLGYEAIYLGDARRLEPGDPTKLVVTVVKQEILPTDRLLVAPPRAALPYYHPRPPAGQVAGRVISALNAVSEMGPYTVVALSLGKREGLEEGHVLRVLRHAGKHRDPVTHRAYALPDEESGFVLVFRIFDKVSYGLVMSATRPIHIHDAVVTP